MYNNFNKYFEIFFVLNSIIKTFFFKKYKLKVMLLKVAFALVENGQNIFPIHNLTFFKKKKKTKSYVDEG